MICLSGIKPLSRQNLGHNSRPPAPAVLLFISRRKGGCQLMRCETVNHGAVLCANVRPLPVFGCRIVAMPECIEQIINRQPGCIIFDQHHFGMTGITVTDHIISRIRDMTARITAHGAHNATDTTQCRLHAPKTTCAKNNTFHWNICNSVIL